MNDARPMLMALRSALMIDQIDWKTLGSQAAFEIVLLFNAQLDAARRHLLNQRQEVREEEASLEHIERIMERWRNNANQMRIGTNLEDKEQ